MLKKIHGHTIETSLFSGKKVLDVGCRDFQFARHITQEYGCPCICIDADPTVFYDAPKDINIECINRALSIHNNRTIKIYNTLGEGSYTSDVKVANDGASVKTITLNNIIQKEYDLLKLDIEGSEYDILSDKNFYPYPSQISVEFHEHNFEEIHKKKIDAVINNLTRYYNLVYTFDDNYYGDRQYKYIDCLFVRK